ncbi:YwhD family protein [Paenibacillus sp. y28]|uniref:YwhD family protein n=1 Tax=Paenibacillus sp. y28 TaxID=3129110 RepID=UPI003019A627
MSENEFKPKKSLGALNVVSKQEHKGFGSGMLDLSNLSSMIVDGDEAYIDLGAIHAKSKVERGCKFTTNKAEVPDGRRCWIVWVEIGRDDEGQAYYAGLTTCEMLVDSEKRLIWKILPEHVQKMEWALKHRYVVEDLNEKEKEALRTRLAEYKPEWWERTPEELKAKLA